MSINNKVNTSVVLIAQQCLKTVDAEFERVQSSVGWSVDTGLVPCVTGSSLGLHDTLTRTVDLALYQVACSPTMSTRSLHRVNSLRRQTEHEKID